MARRRKSSSDVIIAELGREQVGGYVVIVYLYADGLPDDPASSVSHRVAVYNQEQVPEDFAKATEEHAVGQTWYYEGAPGALTDEEITETQEADRDSRRMREEDEALTEATGWSYRDDGRKYNGFWDAVARAADRPDDDEAWATIDSWRLRRVEKEERGEKVH